MLPIHYLAKLAACNASGTAGCSCGKGQCTQRETKCEECGEVNCNCKQAMDQVASPQPMNAQDKFNAMMRRIDSRRSAQYGPAFANAQATAPNAQKFLSSNGYTSNPAPAQASIPNQSYTSPNAQQFLRGNGYTGSPAASSNAIPSFRATSPDAHRFLPTKQSSFVEWLGRCAAIKEAAERGLWANIHAKRKRGEAPAKPGDEDYPDKKSWNKTVKSSGDAWQRAEGKNPEGGLNAKGRASLKAQGQNIKPPVTEDKPTGERAGRKASFCARMGGMKKKLTSSETANDPDSRINKALRKWNC